MSVDGYVMPPAVSIDPIGNGAVDAQGRSRVRILLQESDCPLDAVQEIRLYHDGKLVDRLPPSGNGGTFDYAVALHQHLPRCRCWAWRRRGPPGHDFGNGVGA